MKLICVIGVVVLMLQGCFAPPVTKTKADEEKNDHENDIDNNIDTELHYQHYLNEVVQALESDPEFRKKLEVAPKEDFSTGKIAHELEYVHHNVRNKLDEIKRIELNRLIHLENELQHSTDSIKPDYKDHLDHTNHERFEVEDLKKLIHKAAADLAEVDKKRRAEFKKYEMEKKFEEDLKIKEMNEEQKKKYTEELEKLKQEQQTHKPLHHPGSKQQLEEVWDKQDHMADQEFDPRVFFQMHDLDGNGHWDENEVKTFFLKELDKMYAGGQVDVNERAEEMERMRETVFSEADTNKDDLISFSEFMEHTKKDEFKQDVEWKPINDQDVYTSEEYEAFERQREAEIRKMMADGLLPPQPHFGQNGQMIENQYPANGQQYHGQPSQYQEQQYQQQHPPQYQGQHPPQYQQVPVQHQQVPVQHQQIPVQYQQVPAQHQQVPVQHQQIPAHQQSQYQQIPIQQHPNQVPQHNNINTNQHLPQQVAQNIPQSQVPVQNIQQIKQEQPIELNNPVPLNTQNTHNNLPQQQQQQPPQTQQQSSNEKSKITSNEIKH